MISFLIFAAIILGGYTTVTRAVDLGDNKTIHLISPSNFHTPLTPVSTKLIASIAMMALADQNTA